MNRIRLLMSLVLVAGCSDLSGLGGSNKFACKAPEGIHCESLSGTYHNSLSNNLPSQRGKGQLANNANPTPIDDHTPSPTTNGNRHLHLSSPLRSAGREMRVWIKAWLDDEKDLADQSYVYLVVSEPQWQVAYVQRQEAAKARRIVPLRSLSSASTGTKAVTPALPETAGVPQAPPAAPAPTTDTDGSDK